MITRRRIITTAVAAAATTGFGALEGRESEFRSERACGDVDDDGRCRFGSGGEAGALASRILPPRHPTTTYARAIFQLGVTKPTSGTAAPPAEQVRPSIRWLVTGETIAVDTRCGSHTVASITSIGGERASCRRRRYRRDACCSIRSRGSRPAAK